MFAYGFRFSGLTADGAAGPDGWPEIEVRFRAADGPASPVPDHLDAARAHLTLESGIRLELERAERRATYVHSGPRPPEDEIVHPLLATTGAVFARWSGRQVYHAAGVVIDGRAWAVEGLPGDGKSTLAAHFATAGFPVLTDDTLVIDGRTAYAGPRCIDLRHESLEVLDLDGVPVEPCRGGERGRIALPPAQPTAELGGWVFLQWSDALEAVPMGVHSLPWVVIRRTFPSLPSDERHLLDLSGLPAYWLNRPRGTPVEEVAERLLQAVGAVA
jgi:hypothetical protein